MTDEALRSLTGRFDGVHRHPIHGDFRRELSILLEGYEESWITERQDLRTQLQVIG